MKFGWLEYLYFSGFKRYFCLIFGLPFLHTQVVARYVLESADFRGKKVLDLACGDGVFAHWISYTSGATVVGVDRIERRIKNAKTIAEHFKLDNKFIASSVENFLHNCEDFFDVVLLIDCLEHFQNPESILKHAFCRLSPGGILIINTPALNQNRFFLKNHKDFFEYGLDKHFRDGFLEEELVAMTENTGFLKIKVKAIFYECYQFAWELNEFLRAKPFLNLFCQLPLWFLGFLDKKLPFGSRGNGIFIIACRTSKNG